MEASVARSPAQQRSSHHQRNTSSKSGMFRALVPSKSQTTSKDSAITARSNGATQKVPLAPSDSPKPLGERQYNVQAPPPSPTKTRQKSVAAPKPNHELRKAQSRPNLKKETAVPKKAKSSTNLGAVFAKMNRSSKDLSQQKPRDKENKAPSSTTFESQDTQDTPIWAQFATTGKSNSRPSTRDSNTSGNIGPETERSPANINSPGKPRYLDDDSHSSDEKFIRLGLDNTERKTSASSSEQPPLKEKLTIAKRGGKVMAAVAAWQGKGKDERPQKEEPSLDPETVDREFESVLDSRNVPEPMRQKMRSLTMRVKADFVKQNQAGLTPPGTATMDFASPTATGAVPDETTTEQNDDDQQSTSHKRSRSRPRSRTFNFTKSDKNNPTDQSPSKKQRSQSRGRPAATRPTKETRTTASSSPTKHTGSIGRRSQAPTIPADFISYLRKHQNPADVEIGRIHKLRILLRNETVAWVDTFISLGGMNEVVGLLHRIMLVEWREEHEDQLLHETLLCLKGLCTTERAMAELAKVADELFPALLGMLYDDEKKGPAEYSTRTIITAVLFNYLQSALNTFPEALSTRAHKILAYLGEPTQPDSTLPVDFILSMQVPRPYKLWSREMSNVTREVFWIFLHHLNTVPLPAEPTEENPTAERAKILAATYTHRHFPGTRPPVPAAPYIGGVEWDATTYITSHLDLLNGLLASLPSSTERNSLRAELRESGMEKTMGMTLRTCKEKFYSGVHDGLRGWVAAAEEDGWETAFVREGPSLEEQANRAKSLSPKKSPGKSPAKGKEGAVVDEKAPQLGEMKLEVPPLDLGAGVNVGKADDEDGWLE